MQEQLIMHGEVDTSGQVRASGHAAPHVGIVILNWKRPQDTIACLRSLEKLDYPSYEVAVVDNGPAAGSIQSIRQAFAGISVIENGHNLGFAAGNNVGIAHMMRSGVDYVLLLNDDTEVSLDLLRIMLEVGEADPTIGVLGPTIYYWDQGNVIWSAGGKVNRRGLASHLHVDESDDDLSSIPREVDYVTGCAILVKREVIETVGVLDERFFAYYEETEWCARARRAGFRVVHVPKARMWHKITPVARPSSPLYLYLMARNRLLYVRCSGAKPWTILWTSMDLLRTAASWALQPKHRQKRPFSSVLLRGALDFACGRFGAPPADL